MKIRLRIGACSCAFPLRNKVTSIILTDVPGVPAWCSCLFTDVTSCKFRPGSAWINLYDNYYNSSDFSSVRIPTLASYCCVYS